MKTPPSRRRTLLLLVAATTCAGLAGSLAIAASDTTDPVAGHVAKWTRQREERAVPLYTLTVDIARVEPGVGNVMVGLYDRDTPFPEEGKHLLGMKVPAPAGDHVTVVFQGIPRGTYALAAIDDLNRNGKLDFELGVRPSEPLAFSNAATVGPFGPPKFDRARFPVDGDTTVTLSF